MRILPLLLAIGLAFPVLADNVRLRENAPDRHVVVKGDTLWDISARFLRDPWKWPEVWRLNRDEIKNPHLIYPGDVVQLDFVEGKPRLSLKKGRFSQTIRLSPSVQAEPIVIKEQGIPSIPLQAILPLLAKGAVGEASELEKAPRILGSSDARVMFAKGDRVFASKSETPAQQWRVMRLGQALRNPDDKREILAYELVYLGEARTETPGDPQQVLITRTDQEILERDRLLPAWDGHPPQYAPHAPDTPVDAKVVAVLGGPIHASTWMNLVLNQGRNAGLEEGHVLALYRTGRSVADPKCIRAEKIGFLAGGQDYAQDCVRDETDQATLLPDNRVGLAFVYRVFDKLSYALVLQGTEPVSAGDLARNP
ncbi:MAG TPA: LysM domain-containing protein [Thiobacillaceae bacterium]|nr:LysM domain-containing protein [Thiobacillaceae bacterium]HNU63745.1 LysM domain-containing protein [Thiobacillaceae bacterium]